MLRYAWFWGGSVGLFALGTGTSLLPVRGRTWADDVLETVVAVVAGLACRRRGRQPSASRRSWQLAARGALLWGAGQAALTVQQLVVGWLQRPSPVDVLFLGAAGYVIAAALAFPAVAAHGTVRFRTLVDGAVIAACAWFLLLAVLSPASLGPTSVAGLAYPVVDIGIITLVATGTIRAPRDQAAPLGVAALGLAVLAATNVETFRLHRAGTLRPGDPVDIGFLLGFGLIGLAAFLYWAPRDDAAGSDLMSRVQLLLPYAGLPPVFAVAAAGGAWHKPGEVPALLLLAVLLVLRQVLVVRENAELAGELVARARRYEALVQGSSEVTLVLDHAGAVSYASRSAARLLRQPVEQLLGRRLTDLVEVVGGGALTEPPPGTAMWSAAFWAGPVRIEAELTDLRSDPHVQGIVVNGRDVTDRWAAQNALAESEVRYRRIVETADEGIWVSDAAGISRFVNRRMLAMLGLSEAAVIGRPAFEVLGPLMDEAGRQQIRERMSRRRSGAAETYEFALRRTDGEWIHTHVTATPLYDADGAYDGSLTMIADISPRIRLEQRLKREALTDSLTGLGNREQLRQQAAGVLAGVAAGSRAALVFCDLDDFKGVNDSLGHSAGDDLLREVATRLLSCLRPGDGAARLGGDEFAVLLANVPGEREALTVGSRILDSLAAPFDIAGRQLYVAASVGIAVAGPGDDVERLLRNADLAMYQAKSDGRGRCCVYQPEMHEEVNRRLLVEQDLHRAVELDQLVLHYQPVLDLQSGRCVSVEALVRWQHPERGLLMPDQFIPLAESNGTISTLGRWALRTACRDAVSWAADLGLALGVSVNVAPRQLLDCSMDREVTAALGASGLPPERLMVEITERSLLAGDATRRAILDLRASGTLLALDDFGTGYSSLSHLRDFPVDVLKLDRSYVGDVSADPKTGRLVAALLQLSRRLGIECVAEGVETAEQHEALVAIGCRRAQGYYYARPLSEPDLRAWLQRVGVPRQRSAAASDG